jgi:hypothetical protein
MLFYFSKCMASCHFKYVRGGRGPWPCYQPSFAKKIVICAGGGGRGGSGVGSMVAWSLLITDLVIPIYLLRYCQRRCPSNQFLPIAF